MYQTAALVKFPSMELVAILIVYIGLWAIYLLKSSGWLHCLIFHASIICAVTLVELLSIGIGIDHRIAFGTLDEEPWYHPSNKLDPTLLHLHQPNQTITGTQPTGDIAFYYKVPNTKSYPFEVVTDKNGFRNSTTREASEVVVIGDSFVEAVTVPEEELFTSLLADYIDKSVTNLGQIWYGPQQELEVLKRFAMDLKPQRIIWVLFSGNDLQDYLRYEKVRANWQQITGRRTSLVQKSFVVNLYRALRKLAFVKESKPATEAACQPNQEIFYFNYYFSRDLYEELTALESVVKVLLDAASLAKSNGATFELVYAPTKLEVMAELCGLESEKNPWKDSFFEKLRLVDNSIQIIDLTPVLTTAAEKAPVYFTDDTHWNENGHRVIAERLAGH